MLMTFAMTRRPARESTIELREKHGPFVGCQHAEIILLGLEQGKVEGPYRLAEKFPHAQFLRPRSLCKGVDRSDFLVSHGRIVGREGPTLFDQPVVQIDGRAALLDLDVTDQSPKGVENLIGVVDLR